MKDRTRTRIWHWLRVKFDIRTVAEGIESMDQVEYLKQIGCDYVQGYVFYRPMPQSDYETLIIQGC